MTKNGAKRVTGEYRWRILRGDTEARLRRVTIGRPDLDWLAVYAVFAGCLIADGGILLLLAWLTR